MVPKHVFEMIFAVFARFYCIIRGEILHFYVWPGKVLSFRCSQCCPLSAAKFAPHELWNCDSGEQ